MVFGTVELFAPECIQHLQERYAQSGYLQESGKDFGERLYKYIGRGGEEPHPRPLPQREGRAVVFLES